MSLVAEKVSVGGVGDYRLDAFSCTIKPGEFTVVIGPNGSGKTSLIKVLSGELTPAEGRVSLDDTALHEWSTRELAKRRAVLPQHAVLDFPFRVREVIALGRSPYLRDVDRDADIIKEAIATFDLGGYENRPYTRLSGGERQRVHLARVWAQICAFDSNKSKYLLLDEPTAALDLKHQRDLMILLKQAVQDHALGVVAALHDLNAAAHYADSLLLLKAGKLLAAGSCDQVLTSANIQQAYDVDVELLHYQSSGKQIVAMPVLNK